MSITIQNTSTVTYDPVKLTLALGNSINFTLTAEREPLVNVLNAVVAELQASGAPGAERLVVTTPDGMLAAETYIVRTDGEGNRQQIAAQADTPVQPGDRVVQTARVNNG